MMALSALPDPNSMQDGQTVDIIGPDGIVRSFVFDLQTKSFTLRDSQLFVPTKHGDTHISTDPIPLATCDTPGLMAANDKCRLEALSQLRVGVLGYTGAGNPNDGGWLQDDIILAAGGNGFLNIERVGNVIRFTVQPPLPFACNCESCAELFWIFDETEPYSIRPPTCSGKLPGINAYGDVKFYIMPESTIVDPANPSQVLNTKGNYPSLVFKRYNNSLTTGLASFELVLQRDSINRTQAQVGWSFLPGADGDVECVWYTGKDDDGNLLRFSFDPKKEPGMLGGLMSNGHLITKRMAIVTGYVTTTPQNNVYYCKMWDVLNATTIGDEFTATNIWDYVDNGTGTFVPVMDSMEANLLKVGTLIDIWMFEISQSSDGPQYRYFINKEPMLTADDVWAPVGNVQFGDTVDARAEVAMTDATGQEETTAFEADVDFDGFENSIWGLANEQDIKFYSNSGQIETYIGRRANIDTAIKALKVVKDEYSTVGTTNRHQKPVFLWNRIDLRASAYAVIDMGFPADMEFEDFPLLDLCWGPHESCSDQYAEVIRSRDNALSLNGVDYNSVPRVGQWQCVYPPERAGLIFNQADKSMEYVPSSGVKPTIYSNTGNSMVSGDILSLVQRDFTTNAVRILPFKTGDVYGMRVISGILGMDTLYQSNGPGDLDDYVRGFQAGYVVSQTYTQDGLWDGSGTAPEANISGFSILGGSAGTGTERWNRLEIMFKNNRLWLWWNGLLIPPSTQLSALLPVPVQITSQYYPFNPAYDLGKFFLRMWPGMILRRVQLMTQNSRANEYQNGQVLLGN